MSQFTFSSDRSPRVTLTRCADYISDSIPTPASSRIRAVASLARTRQERSCRARRRNHDQRQSRLRKIVRQAVKAIGYTTRLSRSAHHAQGHFAHHQQSNEIDQGVTSATSHSGERAR